MLESFHNCIVMQCSNKEFRQSLYARASIIISKPEIKNLEYFYLLGILPVQEDYAMPKIPNEGEQKCKLYEETHFVDIQDLQGIILGDSTVRLANVVRTSKRNCGLKCYKYEVKILMVCKLQ